MLTTDAIVHRARDLGFDLCGVAPAVAYPELAGLRDFLARGYAGTMTYLSRSAARREDVRRVLPAARSVVVLGTRYNAPRPYSITIDDPARAIVSRYAWGRDYHDVIGERLTRLLAWMRQVHPEPFEARPYVDTGPVQERIFAHHAGLGWLGKNGCVIHPRFGSWLFLSVVVCSLVLDPTTPAVDRCGTCTRCLDACPTGALVAPRTLDARRCLAYLTIEHRGALPGDLGRLMGRRIFGCDICQDVCPWNASAPSTSDPAWQPHPGLEHPRLADLWALGDDDLANLVSGTALMRPSLAGLRRNLAVALANAAGVDGPSAASEGRAAGSGGGVRG